jgi:hypothetical protein
MLVLLRGPEGDNTDDEGVVLIFGDCVWDNEKLN